MKKHNEILNNISTLYELSLAIGTSLDIKENSQHFLNVLMRRINLTNVSVWLNDNALDLEPSPLESYVLTYTYPHSSIKRDRIPKSDVKSLELDKKPFVLIEGSAAEVPDSFDTKEDQQMVLYALGNNGFLALSFLAINAATIRPMFYPLKPVIDKFTHSIQGGIAHKKSLLESQHREEIKKKLQRSESKYRNVVENIAEGLVITDLEGYVQFVNQRMCEMIGYTEQEILGIKAYKLITDKSKHVSLETRLARRRLGQAEQYEVLIRNKNGEARWVFVSATPYLDDEGDIIGSIAGLTDITERKKAEEQTLESQKKLQQILDTSLDAIVTIDKDSRVTSWSQNAVDIFGYTQTEAIGQFLHDLIVPDRHVQAHLKGVNRFIKTGKGRVLNKRIELPAKRKSGEEFPIELSISPLVIREEHYFSAFIQDITERKKNEEELIEARRVAEQARKAERQFLAHMSHEIRTPMNAVIGMTHLLRKSPLNEEQMEYVEALKFSGESLMNIISDILDLSKIEAGELEITYHPFALQPMIHSLQRTYQFKAQDKNVSIYAYIDDAIQNKIVGDKVRLGQILNNLMNNAVKFTTEGYVGLNAVLEKKEASLYWIRFEVYDTGLGIEEEDLSQIFDSFKQVHKVDKEKYGGTGLGLSIVKQLTELMGGQLTAKSELHKGTSFILTIPFQNTGEPFEESVDENKIDDHDLEMIKSLRVLVAEDNPLNQKLISSILKQWECSFRLVTNGQEVVNVSKEKDYDIIFMDINMPILDGVEATKRIREDEENINRHTPIIALTAAALFEERKRMDQAGANEFVTKPFSPKQLQVSILTCLQRIDKSKHKPQDNNTTTLNDEDGLFDLAYLEQFCDNDFSFIKEMLELFLQKTPEDIEVLLKAIEKDDWETITGITHQLKSTYHTLGMSKHQALAKKIEIFSKKDKKTKFQIAQWLDELHALTEQAYPLLKKEKTKYE